MSICECIEWFADMGIELTIRGDCDRIVMSARSSTGQNFYRVIDRKYELRGAILVNSDELIVYNLAELMNCIKEFK